MTAVVLIAAAVGMFVCLCKAMTLGDRPCPVRPVPLPDRPARGVGWVDPGPVDPDCPWRDPEAVV